MGYPSTPSQSGLFRQTPPAAFTPVFGLLGLGLAWRHLTRHPLFPSAAAELILGAAVALFLFVLFAYAVKFVRRPKVITEDMRVLPGRTGLTAASLSIFLLAAVMTFYSAVLARGLLFTGLALHSVLALLYVRTLILTPPEARNVTPVWHLAFVGFILAPLSAMPLGYHTLSKVILYAEIPIAAIIWGLSAIDLIRKGVPAPLRPLLAIHMAPAALFATVSAMTGHMYLAGFFALLLIALYSAFVLSAFWLISAGFSPLWSAFTFPSAAAATALMIQPGPIYTNLGIFLALVSTLIVLLVLVRVMKLWASGQLAAKTNAAIA